MEAGLNQIEAKQNFSSISDGSYGLIRDATLSNVGPVGITNRHINESELWSQAYLVKLENYLFQLAVGQVFFRESDRLEENKKRSDCTVKGVAANRVRLITAGNNEDRSIYHTY